MLDMKRRDFITLLGGAAAAWPCGARAQQAEQMRRVGVLIAASEDDPDMRSRLAGFRQGLERLGWADGRNLRVDYVFAGGQPERFRPLARELIARKPDVLFAQTPPAVAAMQRETREIPIVFADVSDPVGPGFIASLARPGGNLTGVISFEAVPPGGRVCGPHSARRQSRRASGRGADKVRDGGQPQNRKSDGADRPAWPARRRRRGDRVDEPMWLLARSGGFGRWGRSRAGAQSGGDRRRYRARDRQSRKNGDGVMTEISNYAWFDYALDCDVLRYGYRRAYADQMTMPRRCRSCVPGLDCKFTGVDDVSANFFLDCPEAARISADDVLRAVHGRLRDVDLDNRAAVRARLLADPLPDFIVRAVESERFDDFMERVIKCAVVSS